MPVHVIGNLCRDTTLDVPRFPHPGETLVAARSRSELGGKGLNQAVAAARAGADVVLHAAVGVGEAAGLAAALAPEPGLAVRLVEGEAPTDASVLLVRPDGENAIVSACAAARGFDPVRRGAIADVREGDVLLLQGNLTLAATRAALAEGRRRGARTALNPSPLWDDAPRAWPDIDLLVANAGEAAALTGHADPFAAASALLAAGARAVAVTRGAGGVVLATAQGLVAVAAPRVEAVDTTGAGDVFCGVLVGWLARGVAFPAAIGPASAAASLAVTRPGALASCPSAAEMEALFPQTTERSAP